MKRRMVLIASLLAGSALVFTAQAAPPEGKGPGQNAGQPGKGDGGNPGKGNGNNPGKGSGSNPGKGSGSNSGKQNQEVLRAGGSDQRDEGRRYDDRGRYYDYFDDHRDRHGRYRGGDAYGDLVYAGITAALAREYALDYGFGGYSSLPPGIRKNLARGKPLPPGIAKKVVPGPLLGRLPRYPGYEWRVAGTDLILIAAATMVVADILYDVFD